MWPPAIVVLVFGIALAAKPQFGDGWFWELGNGIGFLALALLLALTLNGRGKLGHSIRHRWLGVAAFVAVQVHILWFLIGDKVTWEYLRWGTPHYMVAGLLSFGLLLLVTFSSLFSSRWFGYKGHESFKRWHSWLSILIVITALTHIVLSGFYIDRVWQIALLIILAITTFYIPRLVQVPVSFLRRNVLIISVIGLALFTLIRMSTKL